MERNEDWFASLYRRHLASVNAYCVRRVGAADGGDAVSRVFSVAWDRRDSVPEGGDELAWLFGVARNVIRHHWRSSARARRLLDKLNAQHPIPKADAETIVLEQAEYEQVRLALSRLNGTDQEVLRLFAWEGMTASQVAAITGLSPAAAEKRLARAKVRLARKFRSVDVQQLSDANTKGGHR